LADRKEVFKTIENHYRKNFSTLVKRYSATMGGRHQAEDAVQEAYTRALTYWKAWDTRQDFDKWFGSVLFNCVRDEKKQTVMKGVINEDLATLVEPTREDVFGAAVVNEVVSLINKQPTHLAYILKLYLLEGYTSKEVAQVSEYSPAGVRKAVERFKNQTLGLREAVA
jgi:RNA polymerase sigma factor (sigma-70 family)